MMEVNIEDYLSFEERKEICADVFKRHCLQKFQDDAERIFSNAAYNTVEKLVNEAHDGKTSEVIAKKTLEVIDGLSTYTVFKRKDAWEKQDSEGYKALNASIDRHKDAIDARLQRLIDEMDPVELTEMLRERASDLLDEKLFGKKSA